MINHCTVLSIRYALSYASRQIKWAEPSRRPVLLTYPYLILVEAPVSIFIAVNVCLNGNEAPDFYR
jgi:hypothetical protein